ncbi:MAG TPA: NAD(P)-binding protein [Candidatus Hydrogenedentes bacterium]|nr:NAD(P)-binding protein [Candidatus Hydrogenedentota bacterium]
MHSIKHYDHIVVGGGISGLSLSLLLGMTGNKVLLLEKGKNIGGALFRFRRNGIPFDTGFHFTGGFYKNGILNDMLTVLGIHDRIHPLVFSGPGASRFVFESEQEAFDIPVGIDNLIPVLKKRFPREHAAIDRYFDLIRRVCANTTAMNLRKTMMLADTMDEDFVSLQEVLDQLTGNELLKGFCCGYCMCYGVKPSEISFANHARVAVGLYETLARVKDGGDAFIQAFQERFKAYDIEIRCNTSIEHCIEIRDQQVRTFLLSDGEEVAAKFCIFTIHPQEVLKILPREHFSKAFRDRVDAFEPSLGFFSAHGVVEDCKPDDDFGPSIVSLYPLPNLNTLLSPEYDGPQALVMLRNKESADGKVYNVVTAFEPSFREHVAPWRDSSVGKRPKGYRDYKERRMNLIHQRFTEYYPEYKNSFKIIDAASMLTFRDYLHSPEGCAYGIKQKIGQFNLFGKLPLSNIYVAGQSAVMPGIVGAMISSFIVTRSLVGKEKYGQFIEERLAH